MMIQGQLEWLCQPQQSGHRYKNENLIAELNKYRLLYAIVWQAGHCLWLVRYPAYPAYILVRP